VPNVVGMTASNANTAIVNAHLAVGTVTTAYSDTVAAHTVISQSPAAGTKVLIGSAVNYLTSLGKKPG
jgi:serine/threonine-protein kinase